MARIVVSGYMVRHPLAGNVAAFLQYVVGLHQLGHEVLYLEDKGWPYSCYDPLTGSWRDEPAAGLPLIRELLARLAPGVEAVFVDEDHGRIDGTSPAGLREWIAGCDLLLDVGGVCWLEEARRARRRALVDIDPVFTQVDGFASKVLDDYHVHFTYGANAGRPECRIPDTGHAWRPTLPPVVPDIWKAPPPRPDAPFTTVANWSAYGGAEHDGVRYGQKDVEFLRVRDLPRHVEPRLEIALSGADDAVRSDLRRAGWAVRDGGPVTRTLDDYRAYIAGSQAEFSVAKHAYVATWSGWFSDRTVCYLAAGRPAVLQDTGFTEWLRPDGGVVAFGDVEEAAGAVTAVHRALPAHSQAARALAERLFDARVVLPKLLDRALAPASALA